MKKRALRPLVLLRETIRSLDDLRHVTGGVEDPVTKPTGSGVSVPKGACLPPTIG